MNKIYRAASCISIVLVWFIYGQASFATSEGIPERMRADTPIEIGDPIKALDSKDVKVRASAIYKLQTMGKNAPGEAIPRLINLLGDNTPVPSGDLITVIGFHAAYALIAIGEPAVLPLIDRLKDKNPDVRQRAIYALGYIKDTSSVEPIITALKDDSDGVRHYAAIALGQIGDARAVEPLKVAAKSRQAGIRMAAESALNKIMDKGDYSKYLDNRMVDDEAREIKDYEEWMSKATDEEKKKEQAEVKLKEKKFHHARTIFYLGRDLYEDKNYGEAMKAFESALAEDPTCFETMFYKGKVYKKYGDNNKAIASFKEAIRVSEEQFNSNKEIRYDYFETVHVRATERLIRAYRDIGDYETARKLTQEAIDRYQKWLEKNSPDDFLTAYIPIFRELLKKIENEARR